MSFLTDIPQLKVYLVEPSAIQSRIIQGQLEGLGVTQVTTFHSGQEVLGAMASSLPNLVMSSLFLPDMSGGELVTRMRAEERTQNVAFILVSSETRPQYLEPVRQNGSSAILGKPFSPEQLRMALRTALDFLNPDALRLEVSSRIDLERLHVLMVDDSRSARNFMRRVLENLGIERITEAENGKEAATCIEREFFDLVITDYNMPEMDGGELTEFIRTRSQQATVPILMVSSEKNESRLSAVARSGVSGVCDKPFEPSVVKALLERMLAGE